MRSVAGLSCLAAWVVVIGLLVTGGMVLSGCAPATPEPSGPGGPAPAPEVTAPAEQEAEAPQTPAEPAPAEPAEEAEQQKPAAAAPAPEAAELDLAPPVSKYAPAEDLAAQVEEYLEDLEEAVESEEEYNDGVENLAKRSNTLILIALGLGLHDSENQYKAAAPALLQAAQQVAAAKDYESAKAAVAAVKEAAAATDGDPTGLKWGKVASLPEIMKAVPLINTRMKRYIRSESRLEKGADDVASYAAVLAVIAQGSLDSVDQTDLPNEDGKWKAFCVEMRDLCAAVNTAARKFENEPTPEGFEATKAAMEALNKNCEDCHAVFKPDAVITDVQE